MRRPHGSADGGDTKLWTSDRMRTKRNRRHRKEGGLHANDLAGGAGRPATHGSEYQPEKQPTAHLRMAPLMRGGAPNRATHPIE